MIEARERAATVRAGEIAAAVLNAAGGKKGGGSFRPHDFFPWLRKKDQERQSPKQMAATLTAIFGRPPTARA